MVHLKSKFSLVASAIFTQPWHLSYRYPHLWQILISFLWASSWRAVWGSSFFPFNVPFFTIFSPCIPKDLFWCSSRIGGWYLGQFLGSLGLKLVWLIRINISLFFNSLWIENCPLVLNKFLFIIKIWLIFGENSPFFPLRLHQIGIRVIVWANITRHWWKTEKLFLMPMQEGASWVVLVVEQPTFTYQKVPLGVFSFWETRKKLQERNLTWQEGSSKPKDLLLDLDHDQWRQKIYSQTNLNPYLDREAFRGNQERGKFKQLLDNMSWE